MRVINFFDGQSSATQPSIFLTPIGKAIGYANDAAYESAISPDVPVGGEFYYNTTVNKLRTYTDPTGWDDLGDKVVGVQEVPIGLVNSLNVDYDIVSAPLNSEAVQVYIDSLLVPKNEYSFTNPTITMNTAPVLGQSIYVFYLTEGVQATQTLVSGTPNVIYHTVTAGEISAKQLTLPSAPGIITHVMVDHITGSMQVYGADFNVLAPDVLNWNGLGMESFLIAGEVLRIYYLN